MIAVESINEEEGGQGFDNRIPQGDRLTAPGAFAAQENIAYDRYIFIPAYRFLALRAKRMRRYDGYSSGQAVDQYIEETADCRPESENEDILNCMHAYSSGPLD